MNRIKQKKPIVHCITNYVTVNDVANVLLAIGASPIMADEIKEMEDIETISDALVINIGTINERTFSSMIKAGKKANELGKVVVLDPVGVSASQFRLDCVKELLKEVKFNAIKGNISEIKCLCGMKSESSGVDASAMDISDMDNIDYIIQAVKELCIRLCTIIVVTGRIDIVSDGYKTFLVSNGNEFMSSVTGTGCMLTSVVAASLASFNDILSAVNATIAMGIAGEIAFSKLTSDMGNSSYRMLLIDSMNKMTDEIIESRKKCESR